MMKRSVLALAVSIVAAGSTANAAEVYNKDGKKLDLYGHLTAKHNFLDDEDDSGISARMGLKGEAQINDTLTGYGQWDFDSKLNQGVDAKALSNTDSKTRLGFAGLKAGDFGSIDYGRNYGVLHDALSYTRTMPEFASNASRTDDQMLGIANGLATYRNQGFFGLLDGLNFALQYQTPNDSAKHGFGGSISYEDIAGTGLGVVAAASTSIPLLQKEVKKQWDIEYEKDVEVLESNAKLLGKTKADLRISKIDPDGKYQPMMDKLDADGEPEKDKYGIVIRVPLKKDKTNSEGEGLNEEGKVAADEEAVVQVVADEEDYTPATWKARTDEIRENQEIIALSNIKTEKEALEATREAKEIKYKKRSDKVKAKEKAQAAKDREASKPFGWSAGMKYDANNLYLAAMGNQTFNLAPNSSGDVAKEAYGVELVAQYDFNGFIPSVGYVYSTSLEDGGTDKQGKKEKDFYAIQENYLEVGATYRFNDNLSTHVDYKFNQLDEKQSNGKKADDEIAVGVAYEF
jgi:predicted porin